MNGLTLGNLKGFMAKHNIYQNDIAVVLNVTPHTISKKQKEGTYTILEAKKMLDFFKKYDAEVTGDYIFFNN